MEPGADSAGETGHSDIVPWGPTGMEEPKDGTAGPMDLTAYPFAVSVPGGASTHKKPPKPPAIMSALRVRIKTPFGHLHTTIVLDPKTGRVYEVFAQLGRAGGIVAAELEGLCRLSSLYLRSGGRLEDVAKQLLGIGTNVAKIDKDATSIPDCLGRALSQYLEKVKAHGHVALLSGDAQEEEDEESEEGEQ